MRLNKKESDYFFRTGRVPYTAKKRYVEKILKKFNK